MKPAAVVPPLKERAMSEMLKLFESARCVSVPILVIRTADQSGTVDAIRSVSGEHPLVQWDAARGLTDLNKLGKDALAKAHVTADNSTGFVEAMIAVENLPPRTIVFVHNAQRQLASSEPLTVAASVQSIANLRDKLKVNFRMLVLLAPDLIVPIELTHDVITISHALPTESEMATMIKDLYQSAKLAPPSADVLQRAVEAVSGLSTFDAEQVTAMSLTPDGLDIPALWERKRTTIDQIPGLSVWRGNERFTDIVGQDALKEELQMRINGERPIGVVVWIDEIDKALANVEQDTSGVRMYQLLKLLTEMENNEWPGFIGVGVAGAGKSLIAKAFGNEAGTPTIALDFGATESKFVGESEANLNRIIDVIKNIGRGYAYFIATSNAATVMRPELQRRFFDGMWMFDLMTQAERQVAWAYFMKKYKLKAQPIPDDDAWTGAEIRNCCRRAHDVKCTLVRAARTIVPMARGRADDIEKLRQFAHGRFLDANKGGVYQYVSEPMQKQVRAIALPPVVAAVLGE